MSRSNNTEIINPAKIFFEWVGSKGCLKYFDKNKGEKGEQVFVNLPFSFLVLDKLHCIRGFSDDDQSGFWSNEVRDLKKESLTVRTKKGIVGTGLYQTMAPILNMGAAYCQSVYIAFKDNDNLVIGNLQLTGSAIGPWIELNKGRNVYKYSIVISEATPMKKGATKYFAPVFTLNTFSPETDAKAVELDQQLQEYLKAYFNRNASEQQEIVNTETVTATTGRQNGVSHIPEASEITEPVDDLPF